MDKIQVLSNKNGNFSWWSRGSADDTIAGLRAPSSYLELQRKPFFSSSLPGLFLFCTQTGQSCCLVCGIPSGLIAGVVVQDTIFIVGSDNSITPAMQGLAALYLADPPVPSEAAALEIDPPPSLAPLMALIERQGRDVKVQWAAIEARLRKVSVVTGAAPEGLFLLRDSAGARQHLAELIAGTSLMDPGEVLVAVSFGLADGQLAAHGVRWALTNDAVQEWESPSAAQAPPPSSPLPPPPPPAISGEKHTEPSLQKRNSGPNWLLWLFYACLVIAGIAAVMSIGWKRR